MKVIILILLSACALRAELLSDLMVKHIEDKINSENLIEIIMCDDFFEGEGKEYFESKKWTTLSKENLEKFKKEKKTVIVTTPQVLRSGHKREGVVVFRIAGEDTHIGLHYRDRDGGSGYRLLEVKYVPDKKMWKIHHRYFFLKNMPPTSKYVEPSMTFSIRDEMGKRKKF